MPQLEYMLKEARCLLVEVLPTPLQLILRKWER